MWHCDDISKAKSLSLFLSISNLLYACQTCISVQMKILEKVPVVL